MNWVTALMAQFKQLDQAALDVLLTQQYMIADVQSECRSAVYMQAIIQYRRNAELVMSNQLFMT